MAFSAWSRPNMQPPTDRARTVSGKALFSRSRSSLAPAIARTPLDRQPIVPAQATRPRKSRLSDRLESSRIFKSRDNERPQDPRNALSEKLTESLSEYREYLYDEASDGLRGIEKKLDTSLGELTADVGGQFQKLIEIEEPLQKPFIAEALTRPQTAENAARAGTEEDLLLKDGMSGFRQLYKEKGEILAKLWTEWENTQFAIMSLAVERFGKDSIVVMQLQTDDMKPGQQERLNDMLKAANSIHDESHLDYAKFQQDLKSFEDDVSEISEQTKLAVQEMQEFYIKKKATEMEALSNILRQLADD